MYNIPSHLLSLAIFSISVSMHSVHAAPFETCPTQAFLSQFNNGATHYKSVDLSSGKVITLQTDDGLGSDVVNAIAFNEADQFVYGFNKQKLSLVRFDSDFKATILNFTNPPTNNFYVGDIYNNTYYFYRKNIGLFYTKLDSTDPDYLKIIKVTGANQSMNIADFAFHPTNGFIYAVESSTGNLYQIDPDSGASSLITNTGVLASGTHFGAAYFDKSGYFYAVRNSDGHIYRTDLTDLDNIPDTNTIYFAKAAPTNSNDGARCANAIVESSGTDFGDAPDSYKTTLDDGGARHLINYTNHFLGSTVDADNTDDIATYDDNANNLNDEDGIQFQTSLTTGLTAQIKVTIGGEADSYLGGWVDWNADGDFDDTNEQIFQDKLLTAGQHNLVISVPVDAVSGQTWSRFRVNSNGGLENSGGYSDGEVEDYQVTITSVPTSYLYYPSEEQFVTLAYEDKWPQKGDYDFNDVVMNYRVTQVIQNNKVVSINVDGQLMAYGASYSNGFAIQLPNIARSNIEENLILLNHDNNAIDTSSTLELNQTNAVFIISSNLKNNYTSNCGLNYYRTEPSCSNDSGFTFSINMPLKSPIELNAVPDMPLDPFIFASDNRTRNDFWNGLMPGRSLEVHLADMPLTDLGNENYFGLQDDISQSPTFFRTALNLPWAIEIGSQWQHPTEQTDITVAYPKFLNFIATNGEQDKDWFDHPILHKIFQD